MQEPSIFTRIIRGELPSHKIHEDAVAFAFLNIYNTVPGYVLVVPKKQVAYVEDLTAEEFQALMASVKKVVDRISEVFGKDYRVALKVAGFNIPHVHVHVVPCKSLADFHAEDDYSKEPDHAALSDMAKKLAF